MLAMTTAEDHRGNQTRLGGCSTWRFSVSQSFLHVQSLLRHPLRLAERGSSHLRLRFRQGGIARSCPKSKEVSPLGQIAGALTYSKQPCDVLQRHSLGVWEGEVDHKDEHERRDNEDEIISPVDLSVHIEWSIDWAKQRLSSGTTYSNAVGAACTKQMFMSMIATNPIARPFGRI